MNKGFSSGVANRQAGMSSAMDAANFRELREHLEAKGIHLSEGLAGMDFETVRALSARAERMVELFPGVKEAFRGIDAGEHGENAYAGARLSGVVGLSPENIRSMPQLERDYERDVQRGFHPQGTDAASIMVHEMGHMLEAAMVRRAFPGSTPADERSRSAAWRNGDEAGRVVTRALSRVSPGWQDRPREALDQIRRVSAYAAQDASETLAECISDAYSNGRRARPLSRAVWEIVRSELSGRRAP